MIRYMKYGKRNAGREDTIMNDTIPDDTRRDILEYVYEKRKTIQYYTTSTKHDDNIRNEKRRKML